MGKYTMKTFRFVGMISFFFILLLFLVSGAIGTAPQDHIAGKAKWTIMIYSYAFDKTLDTDSLDEMTAMERVGSNKDVKIIVQWYRDTNMSSHTYRGQKWNGAKRFLVCKGNNSSQELENLSEVDMADMNSLTEFINWTVAKYPAERYALVMYDHGSGWQGFDNNATLKSLASALEKAGFRGEKKLDLIVFDMCLMGQIDVAYAMAPYAKAMVASEDNAWNVYLNTTLSALVENPRMDKKQLATWIVDGYQSIYKKTKPATTLSAFDLEKMPKVINATKNLSAALEKHMKLRWQAIGWCVRNSEHFRTHEGKATEYKTGIIDLLDFANLTGQAIIDKEVKKAVDELNLSVNNSTVFKEYHGDEHSSFAHGLSAYFPRNEEVYDANYSNTSDFASKTVTGWDDLLQGYNEETSAAKNLSALTIKINSILPQPTNMSNLANISCSVNGKNIIDIYQDLGIEHEGNITILNKSEIEPHSFNAKRKHYVTFNDGENDLNFPVSLMTHNLTNGEKSLHVCVYPVDKYGNGTYFLQVYGKYSNPNNSFEPFNATLTFDSRTRKLISTTNDSDNMEVRYISGDTFTPTNNIFNKQTRKWVWEDDPSSNISLNNGHILLEPSYPQDGNYSIVLYAEDLVNNVTEFENLSVSGQPENEIILTDQDLMRK